MFFNKDKLAIVYLSDKGITVYQQELQQNKTLTWPEATVADMEIKDPIKLGTTLQNFIKQNKYFGLNLILVLDNSLCMGQRFLSKNNQLNQEMAAFIEAVPFNMVAHLNLSDPKKPEEIVTLVTNQDFYNQIVQSFVNFNNNVLFVVGFLALQIMGLPEKVQSFDQQLVQFVFEAYPQLKNYSFMLEKMIAPTPIASSTNSSKPEQTTTKSNKQRLVILVAVFMVLLLILVLVMKSQGFF